MAEEKRDSALLTPSQREVLTGDADITSRGERSARTRIRKRIADGFLDFRIIFDHLDEQDRDSLLDGDAHEQAQLHDGMVAAAALIYEMHERSGWPFEVFLERAIEDVYRDSERSPGRMTVQNVDFGVSLESPRSREEVERVALQKFWEERELTDREYRVLTEPEGQIIVPEADEYLTREEIREVIRERRKERDLDERREQTRKRIELNQEMFGEGYSLPPDIREKIGDEE